MASKMCFGLETHMPSGVLQSRVFSTRVDPDMCEMASLKASHIHKLCEFDAVKNASNSFFANPA